jgi:sulfonate dioxygenase
MAPSIAFQQQPEHLADTLDKKLSLQKAGQRPGVITYSQEVLDRYEPEFDPDIVYPPYEVIPYTDPGHKATGKPIEGATYSKLTPKLGTELSGRQLSSFTDAEKNELALLAAQRGLVILKGQDWAGIGPEKQLAFAKYFGRPHIHPVSSHIKGHPEFHLVSRGFDKPESEDDAVHAHSAHIQEEIDLGDSVSSVSWHSDVSYELQPPGTTFLWNLLNPESGGDTVFNSQIEAYNRLSEGFKKRLEGLHVTHSAFEQANQAEARGGVARRRPIQSQHPLVRTHPVTGQKALYVNPQFSRRIVGYKREESDAILNFLYDHIAKGHDFQARVKWTDNATVVIFDNRVVAHSALLDFSATDRRVIARLAPQAEQPFNADDEKK